MKRLVLAGVMLPCAVFSQTPPPTNVTMANGQPRSVTPVACLDLTGSWASCSGSGGGSTSDASAAYQQSQLTQEQLTAARLGDTASPAAGTVNARLALVATAANQAAMLAKMPAFGASGTSSADVVSVQGVVGGTPQPSVGNVASGTVDSGAPLKIGGKYNATLPTFTDGQRADVQTTANGVVLTTITQGSTTANVGLVTSDGSGNASALYVNTRGQVFNGTTWDRARGDTNGVYMVGKGGSSLATAQVSVGTTSTLIAAARTGRQKITVTLGAANDCFFGATGVTSTTGFRVKGVDGASLTLDTAAALYGVCTATTTVGEVELF